MSNARYDLEIARYDEDEERVLWQTRGQVIAALGRLRDGDDLVVHRVADADPEVIYG
jgi:hypothetical protein